MTEKDITLTLVNVPQVGVLSKKPAHLILLEDIPKNKGTQPTVKKFITIDMPEIGSNGFTHAKGVFSDMDEAAIVTNYADILSNVKKEEIVEMMFPHHRIINIRNLVFKAK